MIRAWSWRAAKKPETINHRTFKPERDGPFCAKISARPRTGTSACAASISGSSTVGGLREMRVGSHAGQGAARAMGHIELASPVAHISGS